MMLIPVNLAEAGAANGSISAARVVARTASAPAARLEQTTKETAAGVEEHDRKLQSERKET